MIDLRAFHGPNAGYVLELYERWRRDPASVDPEVHAAFADWRPELLPGGPAAAPPDVLKIVAAARIARLTRELGHLAARIDPLDSNPPGDPGLELATHGLTEEDMERLPAVVVGGPLAEDAPNALVALQRLRQAYCGSIGYEDDHIQVHEEREWLRNAAESRCFFSEMDDNYRVHLLERLTAVEVFEQFLHRTFIGQKRFSLEGTDMLVPILDCIIGEASLDGTREVVMGMAHRGRLNVLAHILSKPYARIIAEFQSARQEESASVSESGTRGYTGDVKYHLGAVRSYSEHGTSPMPITLTPNPSHLEYVNPVVLGRARAAQESRAQPGPPVQDIAASLALLIHGDAAFPGQGIVAETLNLGQLPGYRVGGTIHIIVNNQIGFTTAPGEGRSTLYASDLAKGFEIPIVHVNADDPEACIAAGRMAYAYRQKFGKDFLIDLVGYRRYGHNEGDEPTYTQPQMYRKIAAHPTVRQIWAARLESEGLVTRATVDDMVRGVQAELQAARVEAQELLAQPLEEESPVVPEHAVPTAVPEERLRALNEALLARPRGFTLNEKLAATLQRRRTRLDEPEGIEWGHAEALALGSILEEGVPIRMSGQDCERGTFSHRHLVLHDPSTGETHCPLAALPTARASFAIFNSPLSENAVLGFEYGYSMHARGCLVLWEAQFGDFANSAQVIIDQFIVSGRAKWNQTPSLVMLLPHGYEGQGPEHSSARLERFLELAADDNIRVVNCTTAAQYFHVLRRQAALLESAPRPLILMTPKQLLRHPRAGSSLSDLTRGGFEPVLDDPTASDRLDRITRLLLCSGRIYVDLAHNPAQPVPDQVAIARIEELYPFPTHRLDSLIAHYPNLREVVWVQEEPRNMGAWNFVAPYIRELVERGMLSYVGRPDSASPAEGSLARHLAEQSRIVSAALTGAPAPRMGVAHAR